MVKYKLYRNPFGKVSVIFINNVACTSSNLKKIIDIFNPKFLLTKVLALNRNDDFFKKVSNDQYKIIFPEADTITSEVIITSKTNDIILVLESLIKSEPRCISLYEISMQRNFHTEVFDCADEYLIKKGIVDYSVSWIIEECCVKVAFNTRIFKPKLLLKEIEELFG